MRNHLLSLAILLAAGLFAACALTRMQSIQHAPDFDSRAIRHVLVIGHFDDLAIRKSFEEEFVRQWRSRGVQAVASLAIFPSVTVLNKDLVAPVAKAQGFDSVIVARLEEKKTIHPGEVAVPTVEPPAPSDHPNTHSVWAVLLAPPVSTSAFDLATVETSLYDVSSGRRVWSGWTETEVMKKIPKLIPPYVTLILKELYKTP